MKRWAFLLLVACVASAQQPAADAEEKELSSGLAEAGLATAAEENTTCVGAVIVSRWASGEAAR